MATSNQLAICLRRRDHGEHDLLLWLLTPELGKITAVARGARRPRAALIAACQPGTISRCQLATRAGSSSALPVLTQAEIVWSYPAAEADFRPAAARAYLLELVDLALPDPEPQEALYAALAASLEVVGSAADAAAVVHGFELALLRELGFELSLHGCLACDEPLAEGPAVFDPAAGGLLHASHEASDLALPVSPDAVRALRRLAQPEAYEVDLSEVRLPAEIRPVISDVLRAAIAYHLDLQPRSAALLDEALAGD